MAETDETQRLVANPVEDTKLSRKRWTYLFIYGCFSVVSNFQSNQYSIIDDIVKKYYSVSEPSVALTSSIFMMVYVFTVFPAMYVVQRKGLKTALLVANVCTTAGSVMKAISVEPDTFWTSFFGQTFVAAVQVFSVSTPPSVAAIWFPREEATIVITLGTFSSMVGNVLGYFLPPFICSKDNPQFGLRVMFISQAIVALIVGLATLRIKDDIPVEENIEFFQPLKRLVCKMNFLKLLFVFTLNQAVYNTLGTLFTQIMTPYHYEDVDVLSGEVGGVSVVASMVGTLVLGFAVDKTHKYYWVTLISYFLGLVGMGAFTAALTLHHKPFLYIAGFIMGFFLGGYSSPVMDFAVEITHPEPEGIMTALLTAPGQTLGYVWTEIADKLITSWGPLQVNICMTVALALGLIVHLFVKEELKRTKSYQDTGVTNESVPQEQPGEGEVAKEHEGEQASKSNEESEDIVKPDEGEASASNEGEGVSKSNGESEDVSRSNEDEVPRATVAGEKISGTNL